MGKIIDQLPFTVEGFDEHLIMRDKEGNGAHTLNHYEEILWKALVEADHITKDTSDGHHTFEELYDYRMLYNAHAAHGWLATGINVVKSWRHSDGEECFGGGRFIVTAELPTGQVSNHYREQYWDLFHVPEVELPPEYDGHTPAVAANRLRTMLQDMPSDEPDTVFDRTFKAFKDELYHRDLGHMPAWSRENLAQDLAHIAVRELKALGGSR